MYRINRIPNKMWLLFAILSAVFAAATAIRTVVVLLMAWMVVFITHGQTRLSSISPRSWLFLILSGLATGASWLCYFYAIKHGDVSKVAPIDKCSLVLTIIFAALFLGEAFTWKTLIGSLLLLGGALVMVL